MNKEVQHFMDSVPEDRKPLFNQLHTLILSMYPDADVVLSHGVPTYKAKSGWVALGYRKGYVSLYTNGPHNIAEFKEKYPAVKTGTGCINFKITEKIPVTAIKRIIKRTIEQPKQ